MMDTTKESTAKRDVCRSIWGGSLKMAKLKEKWYLIVIAVFVLVAAVWFGLKFR